MHRVTQRRRRAVAVGAGWLLIALTATGYEGGPVPDGGGISGSVHVFGEVAPLPRQPVHKHVEECGESVPDERLVVGENGSLQNVVVTLDGIARGKPLAAAPVVLVNRRCRFVPHVLSASLGQRLDIVNEDPFLHDAHAWLGPRTLFNLGIPRGRTVRAQLRDPGLIHVNCNVRHTWMHAYLFVAEHPYHAVTDARGQFTLTEVPAGTHRLRIWHELLGALEREVTVRPGETVAVQLGLAATADAAGDPPAETP